MRAQLACQSPGALGTTSRDPRPWRPGGSLGDNPGGFVASGRCPTHPVGYAARGSGISDPSPGGEPREPRDKGDDPVLGRFGLSRVRRRCRRRSTVVPARPRASRGEEALAGLDPRAASLDSPVSTLSTPAIEQRAATHRRSSGRGCVGPHAGQSRQWPIRGGVRLVDFSGRPCTA